MNILLLLAPFSVMLGLVAVVAFVWTLRSGQYDDVKGAAERILIDEPNPIVPRHSGPASAGHRGGDEAAQAAQAAPSQPDG